MPAPSLPGPIAGVHRAGPAKPPRHGDQSDLDHDAQHLERRPGRGCEGAFAVRAQTRAITCFNGRKNWVSWHYTVDDKVAIQHLPNTEMGWHAGAANGSSIGIEVCMHQGIDHALANRRAAALVAGLLRDLGLTRNDVKTHKDWTGKNCPTLLLPQWQAFLALVDEALAALPASPMAMAAPAAATDGPRKLRALAKKDLGEIDHHLMAIPDELLSSLLRAAAEDRLVKASVASVFAELNALAAQPKADRVLFPNGIDHVELHVTLPTEFKLVISGPKSRAPATESHCCGGSTKTPRGSAGTAGRRFRAGG